MPSRRKQERSVTPEVQWEALPAQPVCPIGGRTTSSDDGPSRKRSKTADNQAAEDKSEPDIGFESEQSRGALRQSESAAWRSLVVRLAGLRGNPETEALLNEKYKELKVIADRCGAGGESQVTLNQAKESVRGWFDRCLRGSNRQGPAERASICTRVNNTLKEHAHSLRRGAESSRLSDVLRRGRPEEEGPVICSVLSKELEGSRYEGLWISKESHGIYILGDNHDGSGLPSEDDIGAKICPRIRVVVKMSQQQLVIDGFFHEGEDVMIPAKVPIGPFLSVYFEGVPLREAVSRWKNGQHLPPSHHFPSQSSALKAPMMAAPMVVSSRQDDIPDETVSILSKGLPEGWEIRESRSKKGVYYYANQAKGLSQLERPKPGQ